MYKKLRKLDNNSGFTLIEIVIVIVIIAILASIITLAVIKWIDKANEATCKNDMDTIKKELMLKSAENGGTLTQSDIDEYCITERGMKKNIDGSYSGICPSGGTYSITVDDKGNIEVECDGHISDVSSVSAGKTIGLNLKTLMTTTYVKKYFSTSRPVGSHIDSTGPNFGAKIKPELSRALNISSDDYDFKMIKTGSDTCDVYVFDSLDNKNVGDQITATKYVYNTKTGTYSTGTKVKGEVGTYTLDGSKTYKLYNE